MSVIEDKQTDTNRNKAKLAAWFDIHERFNLATGKDGRTIAKLREQWKRMKQVAKRNICNFYAAQKKTGGGTNDLKVSPLDWAIKEALPHYFIADTFMLDSDGQDRDATIDEAADPVLVPETPWTYDGSLIGTIVDMEAIAGPSGTASTGELRGMNGSRNDVSALWSVKDVGQIPRTPEQDTVRTPSLAAVPIITSHEAINGEPAAATLSTPARPRPIGKIKRKRPTQYGTIYEETLAKIKWEEHLLNKRHAEERHAWDLARHLQEMDHRKKEHKRRMNESEKK